METQQTAVQRANVFMFDLSNSANEYGFKSTESWQVSLASEEEKTAIQKKYRPTLTICELPEMLAELFHLVQRKLKQTQPEVEISSARNIRLHHLAYLIAFNPERLR
jgi:hypothetical protein